MAHSKTTPDDQSGAAVTKASVDAGKFTANDEKTQAIIDGWWRAYEWHRDLAVTVSATMKTDPEAAVSLRVPLLNRRRLMRELRHAAFGGSR